MIFPEGQEYKRHDSMRGWFAYELYLRMLVDKSIYLLVGDLGFNVFDHHFKDFPDRCINTGAAETSLLNIACGLAIEGKIPFVYSISTFLLYRPFEVWRTYINKEKIPVIGIASGRDKDYLHDGFSHDATDIKSFLDLLPNIKQYYPDKKEELPDLINKMIENKEPAFLSLKR